MSSRLCALLLFAGTIVSLSLLLAKLVGFAEAASLSWAIVAAPFLTGIAFLLLGMHLYARRQDAPGRPGPKRSPPHV